MRIAQQRALTAATDEAARYFAEQLARNPSLTRAKAIHAQLRRALNGFDATGLKRCPKCRQWKPRSVFSRHAGMRDGRQPNCKACAAWYQQQRKERERDQRREASLGAPSGPVARLPPGVEATPLPDGRASERRL